MNANSLPDEFRPFFEQAKQGRLTFPRCTSCQRFHWYPMPRCPHCRGVDIEWHPVAGRGQIHSFTHVRHAFDETRRGALPYTVGLITFDDAPGVQFVTNIVDAAESEIAIGRSVEPVFSTSADGGPVVNFRLTA